jgi:hypothetical protein
VAVVQGAVVRDGVQAVRVDRNGVDGFWLVSTPAAGVAGLVVIGWDIRVEQAVHGGAFGPFMGVQAYDELGSGPLLIGSAGMDAKTGEFLYQAAGTGSLVAGPVLAFGTWHRFGMVLDYATDRYSVFVNDALLVSGEGFVDDGVLGEIDDFTDAPLVALAAGGDAGSLAAPGTAYFDNYLVVPEPGVGVVLVGVGVGLMGRGRRVG